MIKYNKNMEDKKLLKNEKDKEEIIKELNNNINN